MFDPTGDGRALWLTLLLALVCGFGAVGSAPIDELTVEELAGTRFRFSWRQGAEGGFNGTLVLRADGRIEGIGSPNETFWELDEQNRLIFKHEDGRISTTYAEHAVREDRLCFDGRFHFREGITHHLEEDLEPPAPPVELDEGLPERLLFTSQTIVCLDPGEEHVFELGSGRKVRVRLVSVEEHRDRVVDLIRSADVRVEVDGAPLDLVCAPYVMPTVIDGLRIQADTTSEWLDELPKRVQLSLWDAAEPIIDVERFGFPLRDFRLFSHGIQCYDEPVHLGRMDGDPEGAVFYHSYGIDFAGFEGGEDVVACVAGKVVRLMPDAVLVDVVDESGLIWEYHHLDSIAPHLEVGREVKKGERIGVLGRTGPSGNFSHLHVGAFLTPDHMHAHRYTKRLNYYPWMVEAWRFAYGDGPLAVAGAHHAAVVGETVAYDASHSIAAGAPIFAYEWTMPDGTAVEGAHTSHRFEAPGVFVATLRIVDWKGAEDVDFRKVKVYSRDEPEAFLPTFFMTSTPTLEVHAREPVRFRIWLHGAEDHPFEIDFGDGQVASDGESFEVVEHAYGEPGLYVVTARAVVDGIPTTGKQKVVVRSVEARESHERHGEAASREGVRRDWMLQDYMAVDLPAELEQEKEAWRDEHLTAPESRADAPVLERLTCFVSENDNVVERRMISRVLEELDEGGETLRAELERLARSGRPGADPAWRDLYLRAGEARRVRRLAPLLAKWTRFVFTQHRHIPYSWKYTEGLSDAQASRFFAPGSSLELL